VEQIEHPMAMDKAFVFRSFLFKERRKVFQGNDFLRGHGSNPFEHQRSAVE
jgi:hypothetical protein